MKITSVEATWYQAAFARPIENSTFTYASSNKVVVRVQTTEGITGTGWTNGTGLVMAIGQDMGLRMIGRDPLARDAAHAVLADDKVYGRGGLSAKARSAIDIALWDIAGQSAGIPLHRLLGGAQPRIAAYVAGGYYSAGKDVSALADEALAEVAGGARAFKMKIGLASLAHDIERVAAVRLALGDEIRLLVDANGAYDRATALEVARELRDLGVAWFEEPLDSRDIDGQAELRSLSDVPIASGESEHTLHEMRRAIDGGAMDVVNADAQCVDGVTGWMRSAKMAADRGLLMSPHGDQEIHVHLAAAVPHGYMVEYYHGSNALRREMFVESLSLQSDGTVIPPDRPGHGFVLDEDRLSVFRQGTVVAAA